MKSKELNGWVLLGLSMWIVKSPSMMGRGQDGEEGCELCAKESDV